MCFEYCRFAHTTTRHRVWPWSSANETFEAQLRVLDTVEGTRSISGGDGGASNSSAVHRKRQTWRSQCLTLRMDLAGAWSWWWGSNTTTAGASMLTSSDRCPCSAAGASELGWSASLADPVDVGEAKGSTPAPAPAPTPAPAPAPVVGAAAPSAEDVETRMPRVADWTWLALNCMLSRWRLKRDRRHARRPDAGSGDRQSPNSAQSAPSSAAGSPQPLAPSPLSLDATPSVPLVAWLEGEAEVEMWSFGRESETSNTTRFGDVVQGVPSTAAVVGGAMG